MEKPWARGTTGWLAAHTVTASLMRDGGDDGLDGSVGSSSYWPLLRTAARVPCSTGPPLQPSFAVRSLGPVNFHYRLRFDWPSCRLMIRHCIHMLTLHASHCGGLGK